jgi:hypothetical protein
MGTGVSGAELEDVRPTHSFARSPRREPRGSKAQAIDPCQRSRPLRRHAHALVPVLGIAPVPAWGSLGICTRREPSLVATARSRGRSPISQRISPQSRTAAGGTARANVGLSARSPHLVDQTETPSRAWGAVPRRNGQRCPYPRSSGVGTLLAMRVSTQLTADAPSGPRVAIRAPEPARSDVRDRRAADPMRISPHERDARRERRRRAIDAARRQLRRAGRRRAQAGVGEQDRGPTALARDALRTMRRESSDGRL